jgi:hypothetical protein
MPQRARSVLLLVAVVSCWACGGRASDRDRSGAPDDAPVSPDEVAAPAEELPASVEVLELRLSREMGEILPGSPQCNTPTGAREGPSPGIYSLRLKVNFQTQQMLSGGCEVTQDSVGTWTSSVPLGGADLARIQDAYRALRVLDAGQCSSGAETLTLNLTPQHGTLLLYGDEHSDCPASQRDGFVSGLGNLYSVLASIAGS